MRVAIDAGHGGYDSGAVAPDGTKEKDIAFEYAKSLELRLLANGHDVLLTRTNDDFVGLRLRANRADDWSADCLVSVHANASENYLANGAWVIYDDKTRLENGKKLARDIFDELDGIPGITDKDPEVEVFPDGTGWVGGRQLTVISATKKVPAVLVELGFLTNPDDLADLLDPDLENRICQGIVNGIETWGYGRGLEPPILPEPEVVADDAEPLAPAPQIERLESWRLPAIKAAMEEAAPGEPSGAFSVRQLRKVLDSEEAQEGLSRLRRILIQAALDWIEKLILERVGGAR